MSKKIKIFFVLPTLYAGGAERVISFVSQNLDKKKFDTKLIVIGFEKDSKYDVSGIPVVFLNKKRVLNGAFALLRLISKEKPQIVVSSISHLNAIMGLISLVVTKTKFIGRHASIIATAESTYQRKPKRSFPLTSVFDYYTYGTKKLDHYICQSTDMKENVMKVYGIDSEKITIINNPVTQIDTIKEKRLSGDVKKYITIGRLSKIKGHTRILEILSQLKFPFKYTIIGEGSNYDTIFEKVKELNLEDKVQYVKHTNDVFKYLLKHDMFLQGSFSEGFPNALLESCTVGVPVIAFNAPGGTKEIVVDGVNGFLVNNEEEFLEKLKDKRDWDPKTIKESVYRKFNKNKIITDYEKLFVEILN
jgi:glycosyltransferase involved in cell wall biosynthesis